MSRNRNTAKKYENKKDFDREMEDTQREISNKSRDTNFKRNEKRRGANDVSWYVPDKGMLNDAAAFPWLYQLGQAITRTGAITTASDDAVPGICKMDLTMTYGESHEPTSALNASAQAIYTFVRHQNSGSKNYDPADLMMYIMSLDSIYYTISWITRIYATVNMFAMTNKYLPTVLLEAQNIDGDSIRLDMPGFRSRINNVILKVANLVIPNTMPIFARHSFLFNNYYVEGNDVRDQMYFFNPRNYYVFGFDSQGKGMLTCREFATDHKLTANDLISYLEEMINAIYMEEDFGIMAGDILKAYGESGIQKLALLPDGIIAQPVYNYSVLTQFRNARCYQFTSPSRFNVTQFVPSDRTSPYLITEKFNANTTVVGEAYDGTGKIRVLARTNSGSGFLGHGSMERWMINDLSASAWLFSDNWEVDPEEVMVSTRLTPHVHINATATEAGTDYIADSITHGTEIPWSVTYYTYAYDGNPRVAILKKLEVTNYLAVAASIAGDFAIHDYWVPYSIPGVISVITPFKYHPILQLGIFDDENASFGITELPIMDIQNYAVMDYVHAERLNTVALLGEYNVPRLAVSR